MAKKEDCTFSLIKMGFIAGNLLAFILTLIVMGVSILFLVSFKPLEDLDLQLPRSLLIVMVLICVLVAMIAFFGWYGAYKESPGLLYLYAGIVSILFIVGMIVVAWLGVSITSIENFVHDTLVPNVRRMLDEDMDQTVRGQRVIDVMGDAERLLSCCGINSTEDYKDRENLPISCCPVLPKEQRKVCPTRESFKEGCATVAIRLFRKYKHWIISCTTIVLLVQLLAIVASCGIGKLSATKPPPVDYDDYGDYDDY